jgi:hypothetical protein
MVTFQALQETLTATAPSQEYNVASMHPSQFSHTFTPATKHQRLVAFFHRPSSLPSLRPRCPISDDRRDQSSGKVFAEMPCPRLLM